MSKKKSKKKKKTALPPSVDTITLFNTALQFHQSGQLEKAQKIYKKILKGAPDFSGAWYHLGLIALQAGKPHVATDLFQKAIANEPHNAGFHYMLGNAYMDMWLLDDAVSSYQAALAIQPDFLEATYNLGNTYLELGQFNEAISCYVKTSECNPKLPEPYNNAGIAFQHQGRFRTAKTFYKKAIAANPDFAEAYDNLGIALQHEGRWDEAIRSHQNAIDINPGLAESYNNLGIALQQEQQWDEASACHKRALEINPNLAEACSELVHLLQWTCSWKELAPLSHELRRLTDEALKKGMRSPEGPFQSVTSHEDLGYNLVVAKSWSSQITREMESMNIHFALRSRRSEGKKKITIGYLSNNFRDHPMAHLMTGVFRLHDRDAFEIFCYSYGPDDGSSFRKTIEQDCDRFIDVMDMDLDVAATTIHEDKVDILVDLLGFTTGNRIGICALRPAPVQVRYLGLPGTCGAEFFDYIVTDKAVTPPEYAPYYTEQFVYLPYTYQANNNAQKIADTHMTRLDFGLPEEGIVFCSFNQSYKIKPSMFGSWLKILDKIQGSVLWLQGGNKTAENNLKTEASLKGIAAERIVFSNRMPKEEHLARLRLADLALDTDTVNGATTTSDALWVGLPVVTLQGNHFASRMSSSILTAMDMPELITTSLEEYEKRVIGLASNPSDLRAIREKVARNRHTEPLFDTPRFVKYLEKSYLQMWERFMNGETTQPIKVPV